MKDIVAQINTVDTDCAVQSNNQLLDLSVVFRYFLKLLILVGKLFDIIQSIHVAVGDITFGFDE